MSKTILITGASRGLGAAAAVEFARRGDHIIAVARTTGALEEIDNAITEAGGSATLVPMDLTDTDAQKRLCISVNDRWGGVDIWLHTAIHAAPLSPANHIDVKDWKKSVDMNATATAALIQNVEPLLQSKSGTAVFCDDPVAGQKFFGSYGATKAAQIALFESWTAETQKSKISILRFTPEPMPTATRARFYPGEDRDALASTQSQAKRLLELL